MTSLNLDITNEVTSLEMESNETIRSVNISLLPVAVKANRRYLVPVPVGESINYLLPVMIVVAVLLSLLAVVTAFGNLLVLLALFRYKQLRTISNCLIGNLALSDFLLATTVLPLSIANECLGWWAFGAPLCQAWLVMDVLYCTASIWNLCIISVDRFTATLYPVWYRDRRSARRRAFVYIGLVWAVSVAICVPPVFGWNDLRKSYRETTMPPLSTSGAAMTRLTTSASVTWPSTDYDDAVEIVPIVYNECVLFEIKSYVLYSATGSFFLPFVITFGLYVGIFCAMRRLSLRRRAASGIHRAVPSSTTVTAVAAAAAVEMTSSNGANGPQTDNAKHSDHSQSNSRVFTRIRKLCLLDEYEDENCCAVHCCRLCHGSFDSAAAPRTGEASSSSSGTGHNGTNCNESVSGRFKRSTRSERSRGGSGRMLEDVIDDEDDDFRRSATATLIGGLTSAGHVATVLTSVKASVSVDDPHRSSSVSGITDTQTKSVVVVRQSTAHAQTETCSDAELPPPIKPEVTFKGRCEQHHHLQRQRHETVQRLSSSTSTSSDPCPTSSSSSAAAAATVAMTTTSRRRLTLRPVAAAAATAFAVACRTVSQRRRYEQREMRATVRMAIIIAFFCFMWLGFFVVYVVASWCPEDVCPPIPQGLFAFLFWLGYSNSSVNPILYTIFNDDFRRAFQKILGCGGRGSERQSIGGGDNGERRPLREAARQTVTAVTMTSSLSCTK